MEYVSRSAGRLLVAVVCAAMMAACSGFDPEDDTPLEPPAVFREWWNKTQSCSGRKADFDRIRWSVVDGYSFPCKSGRGIAGRVDRPGSKYSESTERPGGRGRRSTRRR